MSEEAPKIDSKPGSNQQRSAQKFVPRGVNIYAKFVPHSLIHADPMTKWNLNRVI